MPYRNSVIGFLRPDSPLALPEDDRAEKRGPGYFRFSDAMAYGKLAGQDPASVPELAPSVTVAGDFLPFSPDEVVRNILEERYCEDSEEAKGRSFRRRIYYAIRPLLGVGARKWLQRYALRGWKEISFPEWPIDNSVDRFRLALAALALRRAGRERITFEWFWPNGYNGCVVLTHDVETVEGLRFAEELAELDRGFGFLPSFQLVPEGRYPVAPELVRSLRDSGCEVALHGLNHDGRLFSSEDEFRSRLRRIRQYGEDLGIGGFRSPVLYRNPRLMKELPFAYDMSYPTVAHLDPQRGGCCTVFPFWLGNVVEIPLTTSQDYTLFHLLNADALKVWQQQIERIVRWKGLISLNIHPDYILAEDKRRVYCRLLELLQETAAKHRLWVARPREVSDWWRRRTGVPAGTAKLSQPETPPPAEEPGRGVLEVRNEADFSYHWEQRSPGAGD